MHYTSWYYFYNLKTWKTPIRACNPPPAWGLGVISEKSFLGGQKNYFGGGYFWNIKLIIFLIYFRDIWKMHLLSNDKISFLMAIWCKCLEHSIVFPVKLFRRYPSAEIPGYEVFSHPSWALKHFFWKVLKFFA